MRGQMGFCSISQERFWPGVFKLHWSRRIKIQKKMISLIFRITRSKVIVTVVVKLLVYFHTVVVVITLQPFDPQSHRMI